MDECKPLAYGGGGGGNSYPSPAVSAYSAPVTGVSGRGLHSSTSQLNLSRVYHKNTP